MEEESRILEELKKLVEVMPQTDKYEEDWWVYSRIAGKIGRCIAAVSPFNEEQVIRVLKFCNSKGIPVTCRGGGSSVTGASVPMGGIVVDMSAMNKVIHLDKQNNLVNVQAGARLSMVEEELSKYGYTLGQFPQSFELATVGGYISTMGTGEFSNVFGGVEDSCLSLRVALPYGQVIETRMAEAPRSSSGPDLTQLFIGAEGAFGILLSAKLRIYRKARYSEKIAYSFNRFEDAVAAGKELIRLDVKPAACRIYDEEESLFLFGVNKPFMLLIYNLNNNKMMKCITDEAKDKMTKFNASEESQEFVDKYLDSRYRFKEQIESFSKANLAVETAEVAALWSRVNLLYHDIKKSLKSIKGVNAVGAHISHIYNEGACIYFTVILDSSPETYRRIWDCIFAACRERDATVSHHHGVGMLKAEMVKREVPYDLLIRVKKAIDEKGVMNPGKML